MEVARDKQPNLVLMDIGLPVLNGWQASRMLKSEPTTAAIPVIAFSARVDSTADPKYVLLQQKTEDNGPTPGPEMG